MKARLKDDIVVIAAPDLPQFKKGGSIVRNNYYWALQSIACYARKDQDWEYDSEVWVALARLLLFFAQSGYLGTSETLLEFPLTSVIPEVFWAVATWQDEPEAPA